MVSYKTRNTLYTSELLRNRIIMIRLRGINDTIMHPSAKILLLFKKDEVLSSGQIAELLPEISGVTVKRALTALTNEKLLARSGAGRGVAYSLTQKGLYLRKYELEAYLDKEPEKRIDQAQCNFEVFDQLDFDFFSENELSKLAASTAVFKKNGVGSSATIHKKELERFIIELSWKSSKIEGNTYTLLDTELLLREGLKSNRNTESETQMVLNHKKAFDYIYETVDQWETSTLAKIEDVHHLLTRDLGITRSIRKKPVGITGTNYRPLDNEYQIKEMLEKLCARVNERHSAFEKALLLVLGISYLQPFEDGNKRTARLMGNAALLAGKLAPLSYRTVDEKKYREAALIFYEQNSIVPMKEIFIEQYVFAAGNYNIG
jgi:fido (protein-threonine AMPylation protein)/DNA-binding HxlR family transcriptional regulator